MERPGGIPVPALKEGEVQGAGRLAVLLVEDSENDALLLLRELQRGGYRVDLQRVETREAMLSALGSRKWDLIISDYFLPRFSGLEALAIVREKELDVPFLVVSGKIGEETAVEAMKAGANDYILKGNLFRLVPAIRRELADATERRDRRRAEDALKKARLYEGEIAARIQQTLLIGHPPGEIEGARLAFLTIPSQQVDGDFYDFYQHRDMMFDLLIGDVMGKGIPAALIGAATKVTFLRAMNQLLVLDPFSYPEPEDIVAFVHAELTPQLSELMSFVTLIYARFDLLERQITVVNCGHPPILHYQSSDGELEVIPSTSPPIGISERASYPQRLYRFEDGDSFLFYSDGIIDSRNPRGEFFGVDRLGGLLKQRHGVLPSETVKEIRQAVFDFSGQQGFCDDLTCVAIQIHETERKTPVRALERTFPARLSALPEVRQLVREFASEVKIPEGNQEWVADLELAVVETATNVVRHACRHQPDGTLELKAERFSDRVVVRLFHSGESFDPRTISSSALDANRAEGFGLILISHLVDVSHYLRDREGRYCILLIKRVPGTVPAATTTILNP